MVTVPLDRSRPCGHPLLQKPACLHRAARWARYESLRRFDAEERRRWRSASCPRPPIPTAVEPPRCKFGERCSFAHGEAELRSRHDPATYAPPAPQQPMQQAVTQQVVADVPGQMLQGPMQHAAFTAPMPMQGQGLPTSIQHFVDPGPAWLTGQNALSFSPTAGLLNNGQQHAAPSAHSMQDGSEARTLTLTLTPTLTPTLAPTYPHPQP